MKSWITLILLNVAWAAGAQTLAGTWQIMKESKCMSTDFGEPSETEAELSEVMSSLSGGTPRTIIFNADGSGEENWRTKGKRKPASKEKFLYRYSEGTIYLLDKKSRLITDTFIVEELTTTTLVFFNKDRSCERYELVRTQ
ncbi:MAG: lipocalin family protein [Cyclobacteriaceae bacterium]|nr:lipocalin family protein [Cyclobacteriaceae bacterium]